MQHHINVRLRGIYTTALTALFLAQGYTIVDASAAIQERFALSSLEIPADVHIHDRRDRHGIIIDGERACVTAVVRGLQKTLPHALFVASGRPDAQGSQGSAAVAVDAFWVRPVRYYAEFPATVKAQLDQQRARVVPTIPGHHALKTVDAAVVDAAEMTLAAHPEQAPRLERQLRQELVYRHIRPGADMPVRHVKPGRPPIELWGQVQRCQDGALVLVRHFHGGGMYEGLQLPKEEGDWGTLELTEGAWVTVRRYFRRDGTPVGELYNIGTPVECYPDHLRYVDLELDVARFPDGTRRLEDTGILVDKLVRRRLPPALGQEAICIAVELMQRLAVSSVPPGQQPP